MLALPSSGGIPESAPKIRISVWLFDPVTYHPLGRPDIAVPVASAFNQAHPEYLVEIKTHAFREMAVEVARAAAHGNPPDIAEYHFTLARPALDTLGPEGMPLFTPVERAIAGRAEILGEPVVLGDMMPAARDYFRYAGELTSVVRTASTMVLYANMSILARAGVAEPPRTWRQVTAACRAVAQLSEGPAHGITWPNCYWWFLQSVAQQGGLIADRDNGRSGPAERISLASGEMMAYVTWWQRLHRDGHYLYTGKPVDFAGCYEAFENQQVALVLSSSVDAVYLQQLGERRGFTVEARRMPYNDEVRLAGNMMGGHALGLAAGLSQAKQDGALAFMQRLVSPRNDADWARRRYRVPVTRAAADVLDQEGWFDRHPNLRVAGDQLGESDGSPAALGPVLGAQASIVGELTGAMHAILADDAEPMASFAGASERAQQMLDAYNSHCAGPPRRTPRDFVLSV